MLSKSGGYKLVAPDGGYGYIICISMIVMTTCCISHISCFGMLYNDFFVETETNVGMVTIIISASTIVVSITGIITNVAVKKYNLRKVAMAGAFLYTMGWFSNIFIREGYQMIFTIGIMQSVGIGFLMTTVFTSFNEYFVKKRIMMMSTCQVIIGIGAMIYPLFLEKLLDVYGYRGMLLFQTGIVTHTYFSAITLQPVKWHSVKVYIYEKVDQDELTPITKSVTDTSCIIHQDISVKDHKMSDQLKLTNKNIQKTGRFTVRNLSLNDLTESSIKMSYQDIECHQERDLKWNSVLWKKIVKLLDLDLLNDYVLLNIMIGVSIGMFTDICFVLMLPLFLYSIEFTTSNIANFISVMAATDLVARIFLAVLSKFYTFKSRNLFFYVLIATAFARIIFIQCNQFWTFMIMAGVIGFLRGLLQVPFSLVYAEYIPEKFLAAYGLATFFMGNTTTLLNPLMGLLRDLTDSYSAVFYTLSFISLLCIIPWTIEFLYYKQKPNNDK